jgi:protein TonB
MFSDTRFTGSMFTSTISSTWNERSRLGLTTLTSFGLQALACAALLVLPLLRPMRLPLLRPLSTPVTLGQPLAEAPTVRTHASANASATNAPAVFIFRAPSRILTGTPTSGDDGPPQIGPSGPGTGALGPGSPNGLLSVFGTGVRQVLPLQPVAVAPTVRISHMDEGDLVHKVLPVYPSLARTARIQGQVVLQALISRQGVIENLKVLSGHPMLAPAAKEAVRQWRYRPYVLNNEPVEVETQITVNFSLAGN